MGRSFVIFLAATVVSAFFAGLGWGLSCGLVGESQRKTRLRLLTVWALRGLALPTFIWMLMNIGLSWNFQPFMPEVQWAQANGEPWFTRFLAVVGKGLFLLTSYWTTITLAWSLVLAIQGAERETRKSFLSLCGAIGLGMAIPAIGMVLLGGLPLIGLAGIAFLGPMAGYGRNILKPKPTPPMYARAIARMKFGKYAEAEWEIIRELEKREDDFQGWMMMADLYANHFHDIHEAEQTILEICDQKRTSSSQLSVALHRLADWQLALANDPEAARRALQMICDRLPGSHLAHMAQLRMNQLPRTVTELRAQKVASTIPLPALGDTFDDQTDLAPPTNRDKAVAMANGFVQELKLNPNNISARERLARTFAEQLEQSDRGLEQLALLLNMPDQSDSKRAEWLGLTAAWHIKYRQDTETGRQILERLIQEFPGTAQAFAARRRLQLLQRQA